MASAGTRRSAENSTGGRDSPNLNKFGVPACRLTPMVIFTALALLGMVLVCIGACICGFLWHDLIPKVTIYYTVQDIRFRDNLNVPADRMSYQAAVTTARVTSTTEI
ncbi:unnamed protein product [Soboliphyme baturini]|uniref:Col_cuticle_N domain-containing protein n=1 Tax=Soboliphyme baturini TaxID=241478 RepID=A0A183IGR3_9BILA|nr:unnamed protein product [Soboliphyme baturini]